MRSEALEIIDWLSRKGHVSGHESGILREMDTRASGIIDRLRTAEKISLSESSTLRARQAKQTMKDTFRRIDKKLRRKGTYVTQGGLPSLGKRRP